MINWTKDKKRFWQEVKLLAVNNYGDWHYSKEMRGRYPGKCHKEMESQLATNRVYLAIEELLIAEGETPYTRSPAEWQLALNNQLKDLLGSGVDEAVLGIVGEMVPCSQ